MKLHFAGSDGAAKYNYELQKQHAKNRLESFYTLKTKPPSMQFDMLLDSGGFVARTKGITISVSEYANYINTHKVTKAFNLDTNNLEETLDNQKHLEQHTDAYIIPIYHESDYREGNTELLSSFISNYPYIATGGTAGTQGSQNARTSFFDYVFAHTRDKIKVHGLGVTANKLLVRYPFYSVDSTSWLGPARYGNSKATKDKRIQIVHSKTRHYMKNTEHEITYWLKVEKNITRLWEKRGIVWED